MRNLRLIIAVAAGTVFFAQDFALANNNCGWGSRCANGENGSPLSSSPAPSRSPKNDGATQQQRSVVPPSSNREQVRERLDTKPEKEWGRRH